MVNIDFKIANEAMAFFEVGEREYRSQSKITNEKDMYSIIPAMVNLGFSIELFLKSMLDEKVRGHDLKKLFCQIPNNEQNIILQLTVTHMQTWGFPCDEESFWNYLEKNKLVFEEWRYLYQRGKSVNMVFLLAMGCSLRNMLTLLKEIYIKK
ncbi:MAG: hypothetical protein NC307_03770 [Roseburia sp.]|nr:hypothetical protein [Roseburia sp.]